MSTESKLWVLTESNIKQLIKSSGGLILDIPIDLEVFGAFPASEVFEAGRKVNKGASPNTNVGISFMTIPTYPTYADYEKEKLKL